MLPVWNRLRAGVCVGLKVYIDLMTQMSSMVEARLGSRLLTCTPPWPCCLNSNGEGNRPPVVRSVRRSTEDGRWPWYFGERGLGVEHVELRGSADHEQDDVVFGLGREVGELRRGRAQGCGGARSALPIACREADGAEAAGKRMRSIRVVKVC